MQFKVTMKEPSKCDLLGGCVHICAEGVWQWTELDGIKHPIPANQENCTGCMRCAKLCPEKIITVERNGG